MNGLVGGPLLVAGPGPLASSPLNLALAAAPHRLNTAMKYNPSINSIRSRTDLGVA